PRRRTPEELARLPRDGSHLFLLPIAFDPKAASPDFSAEGLPAASAGDYGIVQFAPGALAEKERLEKAGGRFYGYLPDNAFQARLTPEARRLVSESPGVRWVGPYLPGYKVHPRLWASARDPRIEVRLLLFSDAAIDAIERELEARFPSAVRTQRLDSGRWPVLRFAVADSDRAAFRSPAAALDGTAWLEHWSEPRALNNDALGAVQSNVVSAISGGTCTNCTIFNHGLIGTGQIVAVADTGLDSDMCFFRYGAAASDVTDGETTQPPMIGTLSSGKKVVGYWVEPGATAYDNNANCSGNGPNSFHG